MVDSNKKKLQEKLDNLVDLLNHIILTQERIRETSEDRVGRLVSNLISEDFAKASPTAKEIAIIAFGINVATHTTTDAIILNLKVLLEKVAQGEFKQDDLKLISALNIDFKI